MICRRCKCWVLLQCVFGILNTTHYSHLECTWSICLTRSSLSTSPDSQFWLTAAVLCQDCLFPACWRLLQLPLTCTPRQGCASRSGSWPRSPAPCLWSRRERWSPGGNCHTAWGERDQSQAWGAAPDFPESTGQHWRNLAALLPIPASQMLITSLSPALNTE